jgi:hypothetical protein
MQHRPPDREARTQTKGQTDQQNVAPRPGEAVRSEEDAASPDETRRLEPAGRGWHRQTRTTRAGARKKPLPLPGQFRREEEGGRAFSEAAFAQRSRDRSSARRTSISDRCTCSRKGSRSLSTPSPPVSCPSVPAPRISDGRTQPLLLLRSAPRQAQPSAKRACRQRVTRPVPRSVGSDKWRPSRAMC